MPALVFTADSSTDLLTCPGHGIQTGEMAEQVRNVGGALPSPLITATPYWVIRIDADHIKLATSEAAALSGTAINLSDNGTGTHILEIGIPFARSTTYAAKSQIKSRDLNALQDALRDLNKLLTGQSQITWEDAGVVGAKFEKHWRWYPFPRGVRETGIEYSNIGGGFTGCIRASGVGPYQYDGPLMLSLPEGTLIDGFKIRVAGAPGGGNVQASLSTNLQSGIATINAANPGAGVETTFTVDPIQIPRVLAANEVLSITALLPGVDVTLVCFALQLSRL